MRSTRRRIGRQWRSTKKPTLRCPFCWRRTVHKGHYHLLMCRDRARYGTRMAKIFAKWRKRVQKRTLDADAGPKIRIGQPACTTSDFAIPTHALSVFQPRLGHKNGFILGMRGDRKVVRCACRLPDANPGASISI